MDRNDLCFTDIKMKLFFATLFTIIISSYGDNNGQCVMRGRCKMDQERFSHLQTCVYNGSALPLQRESSREFLRKTCPTLETGSNFSVCCDDDQVEEFEQNLQTVWFLRNCPSCYHNFANLFCQLICSQKQSNFVQITDVNRTQPTAFVKKVNYFIPQRFAVGLFDSCKNVRHTFRNRTALEFLCGPNSSDCSSSLLLHYLGIKVENKYDDSWQPYRMTPYEINFDTEQSGNVTVNGTKFYPMNQTIIPCSQPVTPGGKRCSRVDCGGCETCPGQCVLSMGCGTDVRTDLEIPCLYNGPPPPLSDHSSRLFLKRSCPSLQIGPDSEVCCDESQIENLKQVLEIVAITFKHCPSCYHNVANLYCQLACSTSQSDFLMPTELDFNVLNGGVTPAVTELDYYVTEKFANGLFDSCKDVKLLFTNTSALEVLCYGSDCTPKLLLEYLGGHPPLPYLANFRIGKSSQVVVGRTKLRPMNETIIPCSQPVSPGQRSCSRNDCPT